MTETMLLGGNHPETKAGFVACVAELAGSRKALLHSILNLP